jgi:hypothetical protein
MVRARTALGVSIGLAISVPLFAAVRRARPQPMGLDPVPPGWPRIFGTTGWSNGLTDLALAYGYPLDLARPLVSVGTAFSPEDAGLVSLEEILATAVAGDEAVARDEPEDGRVLFSVSSGDSLHRAAPSAEVLREDRSIMVNGEPRTVTVASWGGYEALRFEQGGEVITATARHRFPRDLSFRLVSDLEPYFAGHRRFFLSWLSWPR